MKTEIAELVADVKEQVLYLQELGVEAMDVRIEKFEFGIEKSREVATATSISNLRSEISNVRSEIPKIEIVGIPGTKPAETREPGRSRLASLPSLSSLSKRSERESGGIVESASASPLKSTIEPPIELNGEPILTEQPLTVLPASASSLPEPTETIEQIRAEIGPDCMRCKLSLERKQVVNSTGNFNAELMFVGEAPGADEDEQGFPFVGRAGKLLTDIMGAIGFGREDVFIGNINRCRPPGNRAPEADETIACKPFLQREIAVVRPKVIVVLGATAAQNLLETKVPIGKLRGQFHDYLGTKVMPTFHPAYLLRDPHKKREVWEDMKLVRDYLTAQK